MHFDHQFKICKASHGIDSANGNLSAKLRVVAPEIPKESVTLPDLDVLALDPIRSSGPRNGAVIGFVHSKFVVAPSGGSKFKIVSDANNLLITGSGFAAPMYTEYTEGKAATLTVYFKIIDPDIDYTLFIKHWKTKKTGSVMKMVINGNHDSPITKHIDALETEGGEKNLLSIALRNKDYSSDDFYDYLRLGKNELEITIEPADGRLGQNSMAGYAIRAISIG